MFGRARRENAGTVGGLGLGFGLALSLSPLVGCGNDEGSDDGTESSFTDTGAESLSETGSESDIGEAAGEAAGEADGPSTGDGDSDAEATTGDGDGDTAATGDGDGDGDTSGDGDGDTGGDGDGDANLVCYPGALDDWSECLPVVMPSPLPTGYVYPDPLNGQAAYRQPIAFLDLDAIDPATPLAPNFALNEFAVTTKGRYAIVAPLAVAFVQDMRDAAGPLGINSGYRPPDYNASIGGATFSRHMYGDGLDINPINISVNALEPLCAQNSGFLVEYNSHVHCDWRGVDLEVGFFGAPAVAPETRSGPARALAAGYAGELSVDAQVWRVDTQGFDEGQPVIRWKAFNGQGQLIDSSRGDEYLAPQGTARVSANVGRAIELESAAPSD